MTALEISERERLLLGAALRPDAGAAISDWERWTSQIALEDAPYPELRLLTAVYANFSQIAPSYELPRKLKGKARATFIQNHLLAQASVPVIDELSKQCPVIVAKGLAMCARFDSWSARSMGDVDIHVPFSGLAAAAQVLVRDGWLPKYGMTLDSLVHRSAHRRDSWNFTKGTGDIDLHWRAASGASEHWLTQRMWDSAEQHVCYGRNVLLQSPDFAAATNIAHGFKYGTHGDAMQTIIDTAALLPICKAELLLPLVQRFGLLPCLQQLLTVMDDVGRSQSVSHLATPELARPKAAEQAVSPAIPPIARLAPETPLLSHPLAYRLWELRGRQPWLERLLLRMLGPFSKPLAPSQSFTDDYDLRDCDVIDRIGGPGWGWPEPEHTCFWTDRADARLLIPLQRVGDHLLLFSTAEKWTPNPGVDVFVNGSLATRIEAGGRLSELLHTIMVPKGLLFGPWVELSFRPSPYRGTGVETPEDYAFMRSLPARRLQVFEAADINALFSRQHIPDVHLKILTGEEPHASQFARIKAKVENSPFRGHAELPAGFDPYRYILLYADLLAAEIDPYEHYIAHGKKENRNWR